MKRKIIFGGSFILAALSILVSGVSNFTSASFSYEKSPVNESVLNSTETTNEVLSSSDLAVSINKSQVTPISQTYEVAFSSKVDAYTDRYQHCYITITNPSGEIRKNVNYVDGLDENKEPLLDEEGNVVTEEDMPVHEGAVYCIQNISNDPKKYSADIVIPSRLRYADAFYISVTTIFGNAITDAKQAAQVNSIVIPDTVSSIADNAFIGIPETAVINVQATEEQEGFAVDWCPYKDKVNYGYELTSTEERKLDTKVYGGTFTFGSGKNFMLGYLPTDGSERYPLKVKYNVTLPGGGSEDRILDLGIVSTNSFYDAVGDSAGSVALTRNVDIPLNPGEVVNDESVVFTNIFIAMSVNIPSDDPEVVTKKWVPDTSVCYDAHARLSYIIKDDISNYMDYSFKNLTSFAGYTTISINVKLDNEIYKVLKASAYEQNKRAIENGDMYIRYRFTALHNLVYCFTYKDASGNSKYIENKVATPVVQFVLSGESVATFMFKDSDIAPDFSATRVEGLTIKGLTISMDLFSDSGKAATKSELSTRFGNVEIIPVGLENVTVYNADAIVIWTVIGVTLAYVAIAVAYFFYCKNKYKNDEFRRVKPVQFVKKAVIGFAGLMITLLSIMFIVLRLTILNNSIVVFNPIDTLIIIFTVVALIIIGYSIKNLVVSIKANMEKKRNEKLKINEDVDDDGTH